MPPCEAAARTTRVSGSPTEPTFWASCPAPAACSSGRPKPCTGRHASIPGHSSRITLKRAPRWLQQGLTRRHEHHSRCAGDGVVALRQSQFSAIVLINPAGGSRCRSAPRPCSSATKSARSMWSAPTASPDRRDGRGRRRGNNENARLADRLQAQPDEAQAIHLPPPGQEACRLPHRARRRNRALHGQAAILGDDHRPHSSMLQGQPRPRALLMTSDWGRP